MTARRRVALLAVVSIAVLAGPTPQAGSLLDRGGYTLHGPSPVPGEVLVGFAHDRWTASCMPVQFSLNTAVDPILDPAGQPAMSLAEARTQLQAALASWNAIPTSYVEMRMDRTTANPGDPGFDFVNEVTFHSDQPVVEWASAYSRSYFVVVDSEGFAGEDWDGDGDADVSAAASCRDVDGDGDIELPAGKYAAGTIVDNDVVIIPEHYRFADLARDPAPPFGDGRLDLQGVAVHEFGHSHGLGHSNLADTHVDGGSPATMSTGTPSTDGFLSSRDLHPDDIAWSSYWYPEGSARSGPAALQRGDRAFDAHYAVIRGEIRDGAGRPVVGAYPYAVALDGRVVASTFSGTIRLSVNDAGIFRLLPPEQGIVDGAYVLPVPRGIYRIGLEAEDGLPIAPGGNTVVQSLGAIYGTPVFSEEFWSGPLESAHELASGFAWPLVALGNRSGIDVVLDETEQILAVNADPTEWSEVWNSGSSIPVGAILAVRVPTADLVARAAGGHLRIKAAVLGLTPLIDEERATLPEVMITTGRKHPDGSVTVDLADPLVIEKRFGVQGSELTPLHVLASDWLGRVVTRRLAASGEDLFVVARFPDEEHPAAQGYGIGAVAAYLRAPTPDQRVGETYASLDGGATYYRTIGDAYTGLVIARR